MKRTVLAATLGAGLVLALALCPSAALARDYDCADFENQAEAEEYLLPGDPYGLDADNDGIACEDLPCPCSYEAGSGESGGGGGGSAPSPPPPYRLKKSVARHAAKQVAARFTRRNPRVDQTRMGVCSRLGERRINCLATARGETASSRTLCHLRIAVRAVDRHPVASLVSTRCQTHVLQLLTAARASSALRSRGEELAGKRVALGLLERLNRTAFRGTVEWTQRPSTSGPSEECFAFMETALNRSGEVRVVVIEQGCEAIAGT